MPMLFLLAAAPAALTAEQALADYRRVTAVAIRCPTQAEPDEVVVCGRRRSDRYGLPLTSSDGGTRGDPTTAQREALLVPPAPWQTLGPFLVGGGAFGAHAAISSDGKVNLKPRELAP